MDGVIANDSGGELVFFYICPFPCEVSYIFFCKFIYPGVNISQMTIKLIVNCTELISIRQYFYSF